MRWFARCLAIGGLAWTAGSAAAAQDSALMVEVRASTKADAPVVERVKLYGASHALVIGIDNYSGGWPRLSNGIKDAKLVAEALEVRGFEVERLLDPDGETLRRHLRQFYAVKGRDPEARLFVWYAGHGHTEFGEGYLVPADAPPPEDPAFLVTALHMGDFGSMVRIARAKHALAVFDSCFAGTVFSSQRARPPAAITRAAVQPVRQFLTSGDADQQVSDDGTFRKLFLGALTGQEAADLNGDGYLTGTELGLHLENRVTNLTKAAQTPRSGKLRDQRFDRGDFIFLLPRPETQIAALSEAPDPTAPIPTAPIPTAQDPTTQDPTTQSDGDSAFELAFWDTIKASQSAGDYAAYLEAYPEGSFALLAAARIEALEGVAEPSEQIAAPQPQPATAATQSAKPPEAAPESDSPHFLNGAYTAYGNPWRANLLIHEGRYRLKLVCSPLVVKTLKGRFLEGGRINRRFHTRRTDFHLSGTPEALRIVSTATSCGAATLSFRKAG